MDLTANSSFQAVNHPHPDKRHVMCVIRHCLIGEKAKRGTARSLGHYHGLLQTYLTAKRLTICPHKPHQLSGLRDLEDALAGHKKEGRRFKRAG